MAITYVGSASVTAGGGAGAAVNTATATLPTGLANNDVLLLFVQRGHDYALTSGTPAGYTHVRNILDAGTSPAGVQMDIYRRICDGSETTTGPAFTTGTNTRWVVHSVAYRGVNTTTPFIDENGQAESGTSGTHSAPALTNSNASAWGVYAGALRGTVTPVSWTPPTGMTERLDTDALVANSTNVSAVLADTAGSVATGSVTYSGVVSAVGSTVVSWAGLLNPIATGLAPPTSLTATAISDTQIDVDYTRAVGATGEDIERDGTVIVNGYSGTLPFHDTGLTPGTLYSYRVRSVA